MAGDLRSGVLVWGAAASLMGVCAAIARLFNTVQPHPYMDEVFHIPQVVRYCQHNFSYWDPMITTLPGLYLSTLLWIEPLSWILQVQPSSLCSAAVLRAQNVLFTVLTFVVLHVLLTKIHKSSSPAALLLSTLSLTIFPPLFFFSFLYYTDIGATFLTLLSYALSLRHHHISSAGVLLLAICFRQTCVVWVVFTAGTVGLKIIEPKFNVDKKGQFPLYSYTSTLVRSVLDNFTALLSSLWPYAVVAVLFVVFVIWNGSVVVGDKSHHQASLHIPQVFYFATFACFFACGQLILNWRIAFSFVKQLCQPQWMLGLCVLALCGYLAVKHFTYEHPYLLADNRHYPFYIWKNIFRYHPEVKYFLVPGYSVAVLLMLYALSNSQSELWIFLYAVCCMVALLPQQLLEFRYFILPYLLFRVHIPQGVWPSLVAELLLYVAVNGATVWLFLYRPFHWPDSDSEQRFMW